MAAFFGTVSSGPLSVILKNQNYAAHASCIPGDTSADCIGTYKETIPLQRLRDSSTTTTGYKDIHMSYGATRPTRDGIVLTTPDTLEEAMGMLHDQRLALNDMERLVATGKLQEAGILLLQASPKITVAGRFVVAAVAAPQISSILELAEQSARAVDATIARGLGGRLGVPAVAQLQALADLTSAQVALDDFIKLANLGALK